MDTWFQFFVKSSQGRKPRGGDRGTRPPQILGWGGRQCKPSHPEICLNMEHLWKM